MMAALLLAAGPSCARAQDADPPLCGPNNLRAPNGCSFWSGPWAVNYTELHENSVVTIMGPGFQTCPPIGSQADGSSIIIDFQYFALHGLPGGRATVLVASSNQTLAPFSTPTIPIEDLFLVPAVPDVNKTCDDWGRCIEGYEIAAQVCMVL